MQNKLGFIIISEAQLILFKDNNTNPYERSYLALWF